MFWLECISPIAKGDLKWRDALLVAHRVNSNVNARWIENVKKFCLTFQKTGNIITTNE